MWSAFYKGHMRIKNRDCKIGEYMYYKLSKDHRNALIDYLKKRPWEEVDAGIHVLLALEKVEENEQETRRPTTEGTGSSASGT